MIDLDLSIVLHSMSFPSIWSSMVCSFFVVLFLLFFFIGRIWLRLTSRKQYHKFESCLFLSFIGLAIDIYSWRSCVHCCMTRISMTISSNWHCIRVQQKKTKRVSTTSIVLLFDESMICYDRPWTRTISMEWISMRYIESNHWWCSWLHTMTSSIVTTSILLFIVYTTSNAINGCHLDKYTIDEISTIDEFYWYCCNLDESRSTNSSHHCHRRFDMNVIRVSCMISTYYSTNQYSFKRQVRTVRWVQRRSCVNAVDSLKTNEHKSTSIHSWNISDNEYDSH
jgi:hypothetical protein